PLRESRPSARRRHRPRALRPTSPRGSATCWPSTNRSSPPSTGQFAGVGLVLTFYCDMRYMAAGGKLTTAFARRGLIAEHGIAWLLPRLIGPMNALDLLFTARSVEAEEAEKMGLVRVLPAEGFREAVQARAADIANLSSPRSTRIIKKQVYEAMFQSLAHA